MTADGASRPLPSASTKVRLLNRLPTLHLGGGDYSSCPISGIQRNPARSRRLKCRGRRSSVSDAAFQSRNLDKVSRLECQANGPRLAFRAFSDPTDGRPPRPLGRCRVAVGERTKSDVDVQSRHNGRRDGLRYGSHRVSDIYPDRDLSCGGKSGGVCRHGCRQREHPQPPR